MVYKENDGIEDEEDYDFEEEYEHNLAPEIAEAVYQFYGRGEIGWSFAQMLDQFLTHQGGGTEGSHPDNPGWLLVRHNQEPIMNGDPSVNIAFLADGTTPKWATSSGGKNGQPLILTLEDQIKLKTLLDNAGTAVSWVDTPNDRSS